MGGGPECKRTIIKVGLNIVIYIVDNIVFKDDLALCIREILFFEDFGS